jgi:hypothetical protein
MGVPTGPAPIILWEKRRRESVQMAKGKIKKHTSVKDAVFLNVPYDAQFSELFSAYICGLCAFGLTPRATLELPVETRLDRIVGLIEACRYSIHDLSRTTLDPGPPETPRFNMPFELGLAVSHARRRSSHKWFVFESTAYRLQRSLSDLNGTDPYIHDGTVQGVFRELAKAFVRAKRQPTVPQMQRIYDETKSEASRIHENAGSSESFNARVFQEMVIFATSLARGI